MFCNREQDTDVDTHNEAAVTATVVRESLNTEELEMKSKYIYILTVFLFKSAGWIKVSMFYDPFL